MTNCFYVFLKPFRTIKQLNSKWSQFKNLWKEPIRSLSAAQKRIRNLESYQQYSSKVAIETRRDPRPQAAAQMNGNNPTGSSAPSLDALRSQHIELQIRQAVHNVREAELMVERAEYLKDLARMQFELQQGRNQVIQDLES